MRDVFKQWYLMGINAKINTPEKLTEFLRKETEGYNVVTVGSSAGGYAAILHGSLLSAKYVLAFNPQFELKSLLKNSLESINPIIFREKESRNILYDIIPYINENTDIFYFYSNSSQWDMEQNNCIEDINNIYTLSFNTSHHGIPFLKIALPYVLNMEVNKLKNIASRTHSPLLFTIQSVGIYKTLVGLIKQVYIRYKKRR